MPLTARRGLAIRWLVALVVVLTALEGAIRLFGPILPFDHRTGPVIEADPTLGWRNIAGETTWIRTSAHTARIEVNAAGGLGPLPATRSGRRRVLFVGDGLLAEPPERYDQTLPALVATDLDIEPITLAASGYGTDQEALLLDEIVPRWRPDVIVLVFNAMNDVSDNDIRLESSYGAKPKPSFTIDAADDLRLQPLGGVSLGERAKGLLARSALLSTIKSALDGIAAGPSSDALRLELGVLRDPDGEWTTAWAITDRLLARAAATAAASRAILLVAVAPHPCQVQVSECLGTDLGASAVPQARLAAIARRSGTRTLDLLAALRDAGREGAVYFAGEGIWTASGHAAAARAVGGALREVLR